MTKTIPAEGSRVRVIKAEHEGWTPDDLMFGDEGSITRAWRQRGTVDFLRDDGREYGGLVAERFEIIEEESTWKWPEVPEEIREDLHGKWSEREEKAYWHGRDVSDAWARLKSEQAHEDTQEDDAMKYRFILTATKQHTGQFQSVSFSGVTLSLKANTLEEAEAVAVELLPALGVPGHYWSFQPVSIEEL